MPIENVPSTFKFPEIFGALNHDFGLTSKFAQFMWAEVRKLMELSINNGINYLLTDVESEDEVALFNQFRALLLSRKTMQAQAISSFALSKARKSIIRSLLASGNSVVLEWGRPFALVFDRLESIPTYERFLSHFPYLRITQSSSERFLLSIVNYESQSLKSKYINSFVKNLALTLQHTLERNNQLKGATLILKGRVDPEMLMWIRGPSLLEASPVPDVEVIYSVVIPCRSKEEFSFVLKKGQRYRLLKNNKLLSSQPGKKRYQQWQLLRPYIVIDNLILKAFYNAKNDFVSFVQYFWSEFDQIIQPTPVIPHWTHIKKSSDLELRELIKGKVIEYKAELEIEAKSRNKILAEKCKRLLHTLNSMDFSILSSNVMSYLKKVSVTEFIKDKEAYFLDWHHIIYDAIKFKDYNKKGYSDLQKITPTLLDSYNTEKREFYKRSIIFIERVGVDAFTVRFITMPRKNFPITKGSDTLANWTLISIVMLFAYLNSKKVSIEQLMGTYFDKILRCLKLSDYQFFHRFIANYQEYRTKENSSRRDIAELFKEFRPGVEDKLSFATIDLFVKILSEKLTEHTLRIKKKQREEAFEANEVDYNLDLFFEDVHSEVKGVETILTEKKEEAACNVLTIASLLSNTSIVGRISLSRLHMQFKKNQLHVKDKTYTRDTGGGNSFFYDADFLYRCLSHNKKNNSREVCLLNTDSKKDNIVKLIYIINQKDEVKVAWEPLRGDTSSRPTHSELANGLPVKGAGELIFYCKKLRWYLGIINNGSGHYRLPAHICLPVAKKIVLSLLDKSIITENVSLANSLKLGMTLASGFDDTVGTSLHTTANSFFSPVTRQPSRRESKVWVLDESTVCKK